MASKTSDKMTFVFFEDLAKLCFPVVGKKQSKVAELITHHSSGWQPLFFWQSELTCAGDVLRKRNSDSLE